MKPLQTLQLLLVSALWGSSFIFIRVVSPELGPVLTAFLRVFIGGASLLAYALLTRQGLKWRRFGAWTALVGLLNSALPFTLIAFAELRLSASVSAILNATAPLWTVLIAALWFGEGFTPRRVAGTALGLLGVALLVGWSPLEPGFQTLLSVAALLTAAFCYGLAANLTRAKLQGAPPLGMATGALLTSSLALAPLTPLNPVHVRPGLLVMACVLALALACSALAYLIFLPLVVNLGASRTSVVGSLVPVFGVLWGATLLHEALTLEKLLACGVILLGAALVTVEYMRKSPAPTADAV